MLVAIPILSLIGLYAFAAATTASTAINLQRSRTLFTSIGTPTGNFESQSDLERQSAVVYLAAPLPSNLAALRAQEAKTEQAGVGLRNAIAAAMGSANAPEKSAFDAMLTAAANLSAVRTQVASLSISRPAAIAAYAKVVADGDEVLTQVVLREDSTQVVSQSLALVRAGESEESLLEANALLTGDILARTFSAADRQQFTQFIGAHRAIFAQALADMQPRYRAFYQRDISPQATASLTALENKVIADNHPTRMPPVQITSWTLAAGAVSAGLSNAAEQSAAQLTTDAQPAANATFLRVYLVGGLGLLAIILSIIMSVWIGRGLVSQLAALRRSALDLANTRLPSVMERLRAGQKVDVAQEAPPLEVSGDEIGQVREAFNAVQRTAVEAAVDEANLRRGVSDVFRNLARRSQSLLHRQLALLDAMERRASEPEELEDLFRIDHLTTRMRRHSEGLIILSGESPGRGWRHPVPFVDVLRAAVAEVEDYTRIRVTTGTRVALIGPAVADVIHMVAELAENATIFSPPNAPVRIHGDVVGRGYAIEIEDRGLGIAEEKMAAINHDFAHPPQFDLSGSEQLGLFVAGQLARRHDIRITLQPSAFGGTTAIVLIPKTLVVDEGAYDVQASVTPTGERAARIPGGRYGSLGQTALTEPLGQRSALPSAAEPPPAPPASPSPVGHLPSGNGSEPPAFPDTPAAFPDTPAAFPDTPAAPAASAPGDGGDSLFTPRRPHTAASPSGSFFAFGTENGNDLPAQPPPAPPAPPAPSRPAAGPPAASEGPQPRISAAELNEMGLPVRVRRASMAPQLRDSGSHAAGADDGVPSAPSPEAARSTMTALQRGWERGRYISGTVTPSSETTLGSDKSGNGGEQRNDE
ncbi:MAG TPA: nitrate- and nitrite sensing domain-containing protein [Streptosporangiaceae bacterium]|nr:nitrate- and nitrite sensing domain-containing protein [Streptosporangiaceae bacterium]